jgi:hypothetical protein
MTSASPGRGVTSFPLGSPTGFLPLEKAPDVIKNFIMVQSLILCWTGYEWFGQVTLRSFPKWFICCCVWRLNLCSMVVTYSLPESSAFSSSPSSLAAIMTLWGCHFCPFLPPLVPFLALLMAALDGAAQLLLATIFALPRMKVTPTASSLEVYRVVI